jgi:hypothetical protein
MVAPELFFFFLITWLSPVAHTCNPREVEIRGLWFKTNLGKKLYLKDPISKLGVVVDAVIPATRVATFGRRIMV